MTREPDFIITTHSWLPGARLSMPGVWGNRQFDSIEDAQAEAFGLDPHARIVRGHVQRANRK